MRHEHILNDFEEIRATMQDWEFDYEKSVTYIGTDTIRIVFKGVETTKKNVPFLMGMLHERFPSFTILQKGTPTTIMIYIKGPGRQSSYRSWAGNIAGEMV